MRPEATAPCLLRSAAMGPFAREHLRLAYLRTIVEVDLEDRTVAGSDVVAELGPVRVVTAWNPLSKTLDIETNRTRHQALLARLASEDIRWWPARWVSFDGRWFEESVAIVGAGERRARAIGSAFEQHAVFELTEEEHVVHGCSSRWRRSRPIDAGSWVPPARSDLTLDQALEHELGFGLSTRVKRFGLRGWRHEGDTDLPCDRCGESLRLFTALTPGRSGDWFESSAIVCARCEDARLPSQAPPGVCKAVQRWSDWRLARSDAAELATDPAEYQCYVVALDAGAAGWDPDLEWVYVGQSALTPEERLLQHKAGYKASSTVRRYGVELRLDLMEGLPILNSRCEAEAYEGYLAERLRLRGLGVKGGH